MTRKYFGTDGIRGKANQHPMTADIALKCAMAAAHVLRGKNAAAREHNKVLIGKDTRQSCYMLEQAMAAGFLAMGMEVILVGPLPTPAVAYLTRSLRVDLGVMISASHNPYEDNGIKFFGHDGYKLSDETELAIEAGMDSDLTDHLASSDDIGQAVRLDSANGRYIEFVKSSVPSGMRFDGLKIVVDCANGAAYKVAPKVLWELGAEVITIGVTPNGKNINHECGATHTKALEERVVAEGADVGIALDGDADRIIMVDQNGTRIDGDQLMAVIARDWAEQGLLKGGGVAATVMSNLGFERFLKSMDLNLERTAVGDRYVVERMREMGMNLGGEQSGHMVLSDFSTTGDGLLAALQILVTMKRSGLDIARLCHVFETVPQVLENVRLDGILASDVMDNVDVKQAISDAQDNLNGAGRVLVRPSGTEPLVRVMAEGDDEKSVVLAIQSIVGEIKKIK
ncbi:MAG: phosphoglucosamine mutase [Alphaproteobacteria bacterium]|nr:MAG: phosphoglucosamine mutase [Alphaproteobacteria bacterium]